MHIKTTRKRVALIYGGEGYEHNISVMSADNLYKLIDTELYEVIKVKIERSGEWIVYDTRRGKTVRAQAFPVRIGNRSGLLSNGRIIPIDCAIPCLHGNMGEDGVIQGALTAAGIKFVGEDVYASSLTADKAFTKLAAEHLGIPTAKFTLLLDGASEAKEKAEAEIGYPMFIKPARLGSSLGASPVLSDGDFERAYENARRYGDRIIAEELVRYEYELECGYFNGSFSAGGRILSGGEFYDYDAKYEKDTKTEVTSGKDESAEGVAVEYSKRLERLIGIRNLSRIDFFVTKDGEVIFNEINAFPGMTATSLYPILTEDMGYKKGEFINLLIQKALGDDRDI